MPKISPARASLINISVEEENLAGIPFAVLERRVGKRTGKIEIKGTKFLPDGTEMRVVWQVQGNNELGLPTEQDLDIFVALGMLTFQNNFAKTISFTGREIARILNIGSVHGRFYQRLKMAMDRFIPLRFRALTETDHQEEVKWLNVFQEASFALDHSSGRCTGSVTWTDKLIQSMDSGFFRVLDASRYMGLDGITAKHLYRFLAVAFEKTDLVLIDARKLASEHLGILNPPKYLSRLMQTLEPPLDQLVRGEVLGSYHVVSTEEWRVALHRHPSYVPERKTLLLHGAARSPELSRSYCQRLLEKGGMQAKTARAYCEAAKTPMEFYVLERAGRLLEAMEEEEVLPHVAAGLIRRALDMESGSDEGREALDQCEIAVEICRHKRRSRQALKNPAGLLIKIAKDAAARSRLVNEEMEKSLKQRFRQREHAVLREQDETEERELVLEYEQFQQRFAREAFRDMPEAGKHALRREKADFLKQQGHFEKITQNMQQQQADERIVHDLLKQAPPYEKWLLRKRAQQAVLPFAMAGDVAGDASL